MVVHNLPEDDHGRTSEERSERDKAMFTQIVKEVLRLTTRVTKAFRAGKVQSDKPRLMIATLENG